MPTTAGALLQQGGQSSPISPGMSEQEAGEAITRYMDSVAEVTSGEGGDIDMFDGDLAPRGEDAADSSSSDESEATARSDDRTSDASDSDDEDEPAASSEAEQDDDQDDADAQAPSLEASQLAAILGVDEEALVVGDDGDLKLRYRVDGEQGEATLQDVLASYQLQGHVNRKSEQLSEERRRLNEAAAAREQEMMQAIERVGAFQQVMEDRVLDKYSQVDWDALKAQDPGRAALLQQEMMQEVQAIRTEAGRAHEEVQKQRAALHEQHTAAHQRWLYEQQQALFTYLPDLADENKRPAILTEYQEYLVREMGFTPEEVQNTHDHRFLRVIDDAVRYRRMLRENGGNANGNGQAEKLAKKKLVKVPRVARGGVGRDGEADQRRDRRQTAAKRLSKSGSDEDAARFAVESGIADHVLGE